MKNTPRYIAINNELLPESAAKLGVNDLSIQRGYGIFDFLKTIDNRPIFIDDHLNRFYRSAAEMNLIVDTDPSALKQVINRLMDRNRLPDSAIKIILTGGYSEDGYAMGKPNLIITQVPFIMEDYRNLKGLRLVTYPHQRQLPAIKTTDYIQAIRLRPFITENDADDVLYHNNGLISECPRANFFIVTGDEIITPKKNILSGIIRSKVLLLKIAGYNITEKAITKDDLASAREAFITSSTRHAHPVTFIDGRAVGYGQPRAVTGLINEKLNELTALSINQLNPPVV